METGDYDKRTPLHLACSSGHLDIVEYLVEKGVNINCTDRWESTPLNDAKMSSIIKYLKEKGAIEGK